MLASQMACLLILQSGSRGAASKTAKDPQKKIEKGLASRWTSFWLPAGIVQSIARARISAVKCIAVAIDFGVLNFWQSSHQSITNSFRPLKPSTDGLWEIVTWSLKGDWTWTLSMMRWCVRCFEDILAPQMFCTKFCLGWLHKLNFEIMLSDPRSG